MQQQLLTEDLTDVRNNSLGVLLTTLAKDCQNEDKKIASKAQECLAKTILSLYEAESYNKAIETGVQMIKKLPRVEDI